MPRYRFGTFEFDGETLELRKNGRRIRVRPQSLRLLALLLARPGDVVSREEIQQALWGSDTFVDFEQGVNHCVKQIRAALGDAAESPRYIQTLPRRGYRFVAPVGTNDRIESAQPSPGGVSSASIVHPADAEASVETSRLAESQTRSPWRHRTSMAALGIGALAVLVGAVSLLRTSGGGASGQPTLAIVPFAANGTDETIGAGLASALATRLGAQHLARVISVRPPGVKPRDAESLVEIGRAVSATVVLSGEITARDSGLTVLTRLTNVRSGSTMWSGQFRIEADDVFSVDDVIAGRVLDALELRVAAAEQDRLRRRYTSNAVAYGQYLQGRAALVEYTPDGTRRAVEAFERALEKDPAYVLARAGRAMACADMYLRFATPADVDRWGACAEVESRAALDVDRDLAEAHLARAAVARKREFDWGLTIEASQRALVLNPNLDQAHFFMAAAYYHLGYMDDALVEMDRGRRLHGADVVEPMRIEALVALFSGNFAPARARLEEISRRSSQPIGDTYLALAYYYSGSADRGRAILESLASHSSAATATRSGAAYAAIAAAEGNPDAARAALRRVLANPYRDHHVAYNLGAAYAQLGESEESLRWLGTAADTGFPCLIWFERDPLLDPIRRHAGFSQTLERVKAQRHAVMTHLGTTAQ